MFVHERNLLWTTKVHIKYMQVHVHSEIFSMVSIELEFYNIEQTS